jgi:hypothetical protein
MSDSSRSRQTVAEVASVDGGGQEAVGTLYLRWTVFTGLLILMASCGGVQQSALRDVQVVQRPGNPQREAPCEELLRAACCVRRRS